MLTTSRPTSTLLHQEPIHDMSPSNLHFLNKCPKILSKDIVTSLSLQHIS